MGSTTPEFAADLEEIKIKVPLEARYFHYKNPNQFYTIVSHGIIEATGEPAIVYQAEYGDRVVWIRPLSVFLEEVEWESKKIPRFTRVY